MHLINLPLTELCKKNYDAYFLYRFESHLGKVFLISSRALVPRER